MNFLKEGLLKVLADIVCILIFGIPLWVYNLTDIVPKTKTGFFCSGNDLRYPYRPSTVSSTLMMVSGFGIMLSCGIITETFLYRRKSYVSTASLFHPLPIEMYRLVGYFIVGASINQFLTDLAKVAIGRPRPHFLEVCEPNVTCTTNNQHVYIEDYTCLMSSHPLIPQEKITKRLKEARKSFPSGHASFSLYTAVFVVTYLEFRLRSQNTRIVRHLFQTGIMAWGLWICCTRLTDFHHRYSDVAAGIFLGSLIALFTASAYIRSFNSRQRSSKVDTDDETYYAKHGGLDGSLHRDVSLERPAQFETAMTEINENRH